VFVLDSCFLSLFLLTRPVCRDLYFPWQQLFITTQKRHQSEIIRVISGFRSKQDENCRSSRVVTQRVVVISYRRFGTTYRLYPQGSRILKKNPSFLAFGPQPRFEQFTVDPSELKIGRVNGRVRNKSSWLTRCLRKFVRTWKEERVKRIERDNKEIYRNLGGRATQKDGGR